MKDIYVNDQGGIDFILDEAEMKKFNISKQTLSSGEFMPNELLIYVHKQAKKMGIEDVVDFFEESKGSEVLIMAEVDEDGDIVFSVTNAFDIPFEELGLDPEEFGIDPEFSEPNDFIDRLMDYIERNYSDEPEEEPTGLWCVTFPDMNKMIKAVKVYEGKAVMPSTTIKHKNTYYLVIKGKNAHKKFHFLAEYGECDHITKGRLAYLKEHGKTIIKENAMQTLLRL